MRPGPTARGNYAQIEQALQMIIGNAVEAMPDGGTLTATTVIQDGKAVVRFEDTGMGMDEYTRANALRPFFTTKKGLGGTGMGLPIVFGIVTSHGGKVFLSSQPGQGTTVELRFPLEA